MGGWDIEWSKEEVFVRPQHLLTPQTETDKVEASVVALTERNLLNLVNGLVSTGIQTVAGIII